MRKSRSTVSTLAIPLVFWLAALAILGCDDSDGAGPQADGGDTDTGDGGPDGPSTCVSCHTQEEALLASLEADPLPEEEEEEEESTGEG